MNIHWKDWYWNWKLQNFGHRCQELTNWKRPWCWDRLRAGRRGGNRGWDGEWHPWLNGHEFEQTPEDTEGQGRLVCCSPWGHQQLDGTEWLNNNKMRVERPPQGKRLGDLDYKSGQSLIPGVTSFKHFGLSFLILKLTSIILKTLTLWGTCILNSSLLTWQKTVYAVQFLHLIKGSEKFPRDLRNLNRPPWAVSTDHQLEPRIQTKCHGS